MIDKKVLSIVIVLAIVAVLVLAIGLIAPSMSGPSNSSFSVLFDKMTTKTNDTNTMVIQNGTYKAGDTIQVTDKIVAISSHGSQTSLYFLYQGSKWVNEDDGTTFNVMTDDGYIQVAGAVFHIHMGTDLSIAFDVGDTITIQTEVGSSGGYLVLGHDWALAVV